MAAINETVESLRENEFFAKHVKEVFENNKLRFQYSEKKTNLEAKISSLLTEVDFALVLDLFPHNSPFLVEILKKINSKALNLSVFQIMEGFSKVRNALCPRMPEGMVGEISKMANLKTLKVKQFFISFPALTELCRELQQLKNLFFQIKREPDFKISESFLKAFGALEIFQFTPISYDIEFRECLTLECVRNLPNLRLLGEPKQFVDMLPTLMDYEASPESDQSKLTHLTIKLDRDVLSLSKFRDVTQLHIKRSDDPRLRYEKTGLMDFQNLKNLILTDFNRVDMRIFLFFYGERLTHLTLDLKCVIIDLQSFFECLFMRCETLEQLSLRHLDVEMPMTEKDWSFSSDYSLKELELEFSNESNRDAYIPLSDILSAPNLERVRMIRVPATLEELESTMVLVKEQKILKKVDRFELELCENESISNKYIVCGNFGGVDRHTTPECDNIKSGLRAFRKEAKIIEVKIIRM